MHADPIFIGLDVGTSSCKALAVDADARLLGSAAAEYPCAAPQPGWSEQDPADWWAGAQTALRQLTDGLDATRIAGVGLSGQMHGMVALGAQQQPLRPAILWNDQRTAAQCEEITRVAGGAEALLRLTNNPMLTGFTGGKILWFRANEPELFAQTQKIINPKDYIRLLLTGGLATDASDASGTGLFDVANGCWSADLLQRLALPESLFAPVLESTAVAGQITPAAAHLTGLPAGVPVVAGGGDAVLSAVGMGLGSETQVAVTLGTSGVVARHCNTFFANDGAKLQFSRACLPGLYHVMGVTLAAAGSYQWHEAVFGDRRLATRKERYKALDAEAALSPPGANGVLFLPYLSGERCPVNDPAAKGGFHGLTAQTARGDLNRAVLEGVAFSLRQVYALMATATGAAERLVLAGGGAVSPLWRQIMADVFALPVVTLEAGEEGSGFGAAMVAALGLGYFESPQAAAAKLRVKTETFPRPEFHAVCAQQYERYCALYPALKG
ncbi:MAG: xylulokinase [Oscillospiraceae bacterium]|jgi:xylulokinase|nr:xylulokinase [Oscillospiraceae bacterium]